MTTSDDCLHCAIMQAIEAFADKHGGDDGHLDAVYLAESLSRVACDLSNRADPERRQAAFTSFLIALMNEAPGFNVVIATALTGGTKASKQTLN